ncbi:DNA-directed DNA polymerase [Zostera marina]|uniref:DNA-directed DNA polymerase n=1 Tax=Zostera marina TaxID=29655 RepID=A0A0K9PV78_ZOSMR|nr:DNA-directed DNA polymerase [Zostera marina]
MTASELRKSSILSNFTILRKLEDGILAFGFMKKVDDKKIKNGMNALIVEHSERALLNCLMNKLCKLDTDVLVGHNISGFDLDVLLHKSQV